MSDKVAELNLVLQPDIEARWVVDYWQRYTIQRNGKLMDWNELKKYLFATDTTTTANNSLPWKNSTTLPKLTQIRDNLHSNYLSSLFPNDKWVVWTAYDKSSADHQKASIITNYISNKARMSKMRTEISKLIYDYIDYGNAFATVTYEKRLNTYQPDGSVIPAYIGPRVLRISPEDILFNPLATTFKDSWKIVRSIKSVGEIMKMAKTEPESSFWKKGLEKRQQVARSMVGYTMDDFNKAAQYTIDGFGNLFEYYTSNYVEVLEFYGDYHDPVKDELQTNRVLTIMDRMTLVRNEPINTYTGQANIFHVGWRFRPDNLWAMGPLDNLVGMQYRIDHLENLKADAMDLVVHPPLKIIGEVEQFVWGPGTEIHMDQGADVEEVAKNLNAIITADNTIKELEARMEDYAGAPKQAMGIRTPGEKTAFEVQSLDNAAGRIFQEKVTTFEIEMLEECLNAMLEEARRNLDGSDIVAIDTDLGAQQFQQITADDIKANGIVQPVGARHFSQQATELQNLIGIANSPVWAKIEPHVSGIGLMSFVEDITALDAYDIFRPNVAVEEMAETQNLMNQAGEDNEVAGATTPPTQTMASAPPTPTKVLPVAPNAGRSHQYGTPNFQQ